MKKTLLSLAGVVFISTALFAQQEELKSAATNLEKKDYIAALEDISKAKKKVDGLMQAQLSEVLPAKFGEFEMSKEDVGNMMGGGAGVGIYKVYKTPKPETAESSGEMDDPSMMDMGEMEPTISVEITTDMMSASDVMNAHSSSENGGGYPGVTALRVKGYRAIVRTEENDNGMESQEGEEQQKTVREEAHAIVGGAFVRVTAEGLSETGKAQVLLEQVDFEKLIGIVGK